MKYKKIRASFTDSPKRLYRVMYVRHDLSLPELGCVIAAAFHATFEHAFMFRKGRIGYMHPSWITFPEYDMDMTEYSLEDMGDTFRFIYDTGDNWEFDIKVYKAEREYPRDEYAYLIEGAGQGIWEDNSYTVRCLLDGMVDPGLDHELEEEGIYFPWNFEIERLGDFDAPLDMEDEQDMFEDELVSGLQALSKALSPDMNHGVNSDEHERIWGRYEELEEDASCAMYAGGRQWKAVLEEFMEACETLKKEGKMERDYEKMQEENDIDVWSLTDDALDEMEDEGMTEEVLTFIEWMRENFDFGEGTDEELSRHEFGCHILRGENEEAMRTAEEFMHRRPGTPDADAMMIRGYTAVGKNEDAQELIDFCIGGKECDEENYQVFKAAEYFYETTGRKQKLNRIRKQIKEEDDREQEEMRLMLDDVWDDDEDWEPDQENADELKLLEKYARSYTETSSAADLLMITAIFGKIMDIDGDIYCNATHGPNDSIEVLAIADDSGMAVLPLYSHPDQEFLGSDEGDFIPVPLNIMISHMTDNHMDAILLDGDEDGNGAMIPKEAVSFLLDLLNTKEIRDVKNPFLS